MNHEIIKTESGKYALIVAGQTVAEYTRKADAKRGYARLCAKSECADAQTDSREAAAGCAAAQTPPTSNTGGLNGASVSKDSTVSESYTHIVMDKGELKHIPLRRGVATSAHIDTLTFTLREDVFLDEQEAQFKEDAKKQLLAHHISSTLHTLLGYGLSEERNGLNGYRYSYRMGSETANYGSVAFGGKRQKGSVMIHLYGDGLTAAKDGWETRLYNWLAAFAPYARITRCDLAHDFLRGEYTPDMAKADWINGGYTAQYTRPRAREHGYDWLDERHPHKNQSEISEVKRTGKTFYIGTPQSSRMVRVYEKGCELGDSASPWVRFELQLRNRDYIIPHEILIAPGEYLTGAYPVCQTLFAKYQNDISKCERDSQITLLTVEHLLRYASQAASPMINYLEQLGYSDTDIKILLKGGKNKLPKRLTEEHWDSSVLEGTYLHQWSKLANKSNIEIRDYFYHLEQQEQEIKRQDYLQKLEQDAMQHRMNPDYQSFGRFL